LKHQSPAFHCQHVRSFLLQCVRILAVFQVCATALFRL
jgi:hypothetical protein